MGKKKRPMPEHLLRMRRERQERWEHVKAIFEERLEYHRRRKEEEQAARGQG
jgi:hypothetical protein